jgi:viologen exporter family transport system permease protein
MNPIRLYCRYIRVSIHAQMQYPGSFVMVAVGQFAATVMEFVGVWALFGRFGQIRGWTLGEVAIFWGTVNISFAIADAVTRGFDVFGVQFVKTGNFDRLLLRPRATVLQLFGHELRLSRLGRLMQGILVMAIGTHLLALRWTVPMLLRLGMAVAGGFALFTGILILQATLAFWTVESLEIANTLTYGGVEAVQYPIDIYAKWFRDFLIFAVPLGCVAYFPVVGILGHADPLGAPRWFDTLSPLVGFLFFTVSLGIWRFGVLHYTSTGS